MPRALAQRDHVFLPGDRDDDRHLARLRHRLVAARTFVDGHRQPERLPRPEPLAHDSKSNEGRIRSRKKDGAERCWNTARPCNPLITFNHHQEVTLCQPPTSTQVPKALIAN